MERILPLLNIQIPFPPLLYFFVFHFLSFETFGNHCKILWKWIISVSDCELFPCHSENGTSPQWPLGEGKGPGEFYCLTLEVNFPFLTRKKTPFFPPWIFCLSVLYYGHGYHIKSDYENHKNTLVHINNSCWFVSDWIGTSGLS